MLTPFASFHGRVALLAHVAGILLACGFGIGAAWAAPPEEASAASGAVSTGGAGGVALNPEQAKIANYFAWRRGAFAQMLAVGSQVSAAAARECPGVTASPGFAIEQAEQYTPEDAALLGFAAGDMRPRILAVGPGTPAQAAGLAAGDVLALWPANMSQTRHRPAFDGVENAITAIETRMSGPSGAGPGGALPAIVVPVMRAGREVSVVVAPGPGCGGWFDILRSNSANAGSTDRWIQLTDTVIDRLGENKAALAFLLGHEMGHRAMRLDARRNGTPDERRGKWTDCPERCEEQADRLGLTFAMRAGYDPQAALDFMRQLAAGRGLLGWMDGSREILSARIDCIAAAIDWMRRAGRMDAVAGGEGQAADCRDLPGFSR